MFVVQLRLLGFRAFDSLHRKVLGEDPKGFSPFAFVHNVTLAQSSEAIRHGPRGNRVQLSTGLVLMRMSTCQA